MPFTLRQLQTSELLVTYVEDGARDGWPIILAHGFPYDVHAFDEVVPLLVGQGARVIRPFVRGYGPTSFLSPSTMVEHLAKTLSPLGFELWAHRQISTATASFHSRLPPPRGR